MRNVHPDLFDYFSKELGHPTPLTREKEQEYGRAIQKARNEIIYFLLKKSPKTIEQFCTEVPENREQCNGIQKKIKGGKK